MKFSFAPAARLELLDAAGHYLDVAGPDIAVAFQATVVRALGLLTRMPGLGTPSYPGVRSGPLNRFPYTLLYRTEGDAILVLAVAHQSREPGYWRRRG